VFAGVGERTREGNDLYHEMIEGGVIKVDDKGNPIEGSKAALVYGQMNEPPGARARVALTGLAIAEYFRDAEGQDVLLFVDNIFRFTQAGSEVSALLGRIPSAVGYQPTLATDMGLLQERITSTGVGSITSVQAVYVPADDLTDPAPATTFAHLDATTVLSRQIAELGIYPAVDPLDSTSRMLDPRVIGRSTTRPPVPRKSFCKITRACKILLLFWVWTSSLRTISSPFPVPVRPRSLCLSLSTWLRFSLAVTVALCSWPILSLDSRRFSVESWILCPKVLSTCLATSTR